jgi:hypothetical protein
MPASRKQLSVLAVKLPGYSCSPRVIDPVHAGQAHIAAVIRVIPAEFRSDLRR